MGPDLDLKTFFTVPGAEPALLLGGQTACLLLHGFTANPEEMRFLADDLHGRGHTVLNVRLPGHGTDPHDLARVHWTDWLLSVEEGLDLLKGISTRTVLVGQSMGGMVALTAAAQYPVAGVVVISTPYFGFQPMQVTLARVMGALGLVARSQGNTQSDLGERRQANYPAYARYPIKGILELQHLQVAMQASLPQVMVPALVIQSRQDMDGKDDLERIYSALGSVRKEKIWLDGFDHSVVRDEKRKVVFDAIGEFLAKLDAGK
jgi:carboxylesterase